MKIINASFFIKADKREEFLADTLPLIRSSRAESGNISYQLYVTKDVPMAHIHNSTHQQHKHKEKRTRFYWL